MTEDDGNPVDQREVKQEGPFLIAALMQLYETKQADVGAADGWWRWRGRGRRTHRLRSLPTFATLRFTPGRHAHTRWVVSTFPRRFLLVRKRIMRRP